MKILIVAATWMEVKLLVDELELIDEKSHFLKEFRFYDCEVDILVSGLGTTFTAFHLTNALKESEYHTVINIGLAVSLTQDLEIGEVVNVVSDEFADLGIENEDEFLTLFETGFVGPNEFPFENGIIRQNDLNDIYDIKKVKGITINKSHARKASISEIKNKFSAQIESMEGAAVLYVCRWLGVPCYQIRAISNYIEPYDLAQWNIPLALENLKNSVLKILKEPIVHVA